ncbi:MAG: TonB-dependent receptor [Bacteroidales bacterium]|nr:TonB-dependent receptor [Bacteroidales bacterium]
MKIPFFMIFACLFHLIATETAAQDAVIKVKTQQISIGELIHEIEEQTKYLVIYSPREVDTKKMVSVKAKSDKVKNMLNEAFAETEISCVFDNDYIILKTSLININPKPETQGDHLENIKGIVRNTDGEPIIGASIKIKGFATGSITNIDGTFLLNASSGNILVITCIGYISKEIKSNGKDYMNVILHTDSKLLDEVVVVGFGLQKKINLTGAVGIAGAKTFEERPVTSAVQSLQGVIPGLTIMNAGNGGELDAAKSIRIRGTGTIGTGSSGNPLILIDGMEGSLSSINPQDIETISVLKDAAASSIYGSRAPFGVILVTTKSGRKGKITINYNNSLRFNTPVLQPEMQSSWEFVNYFDDAQYNGTNSHLYDAAYLKLVKDYFDGKSDPNVALYEGASGGKWNGDYAYGNVDWLKEYYKDWSPSQEQNVSVSGGGDKLLYYLSANMMDQNGFMRYGTEDYTRYNFTAKITAQVTNYFKIEYANKFSRIDYKRPSMMEGDFYTNIIRRGRPVRPVRDPNGYYTSDLNYIEVLTDGGQHAEQNDANRQQIKMTLTPAKNWNIIGEANMSFGNYWTHEDRNKIYSHYADDPEKTYQAVLSPSNSLVSENARKTTFQNVNIYTNYSKSIKKNNLSSIAGFQYEDSKNRLLFAQRNDITNPELPVLDLTTGTVSGLTGNNGEWTTAGMFGRVDYDYDGRFLMEINARYDGSSRFRSNKRWVCSPSASLGWNIAREAFWRPLTKYVQLLKGRLSYGELANQNTDDLYPTYQVMGTSTAGGNWLLNNEKPNTSVVPGLISTSLTWEKVKTRNIGLDWGAFNNRLSGSFDFYIRETEDMVGKEVELPVILGTAVPNTNNTDLQTNGWELEVGWKDKIKNFTYGFRLNISDARTKITRFANPTGLLSTHIEGEWMGNIYGYTTIGIAKTQEEMDAHLASLPNGGQNALGNKWAAGDIMYADLNGDHKINNGANTIYDMGDLRKIGNNIPRFLTGINMDASWKDFTIQMFWQGVLKRDYLPGGMVFWGANNGGQWWSTAFKAHLDYFRSEPNHPLGQNLDSYYPRPLFNSDKNLQAQDRYLQNAAYMRLKSLQLGYALPTQITKKVKIERLRIFVSGENLLTFTSLSKTMDPETAGIGRHGGSIYPLSKTYSFGLNVNF